MVDGPARRDEPALPGWPRGDPVLEIRRLVKRHGTHTAVDGLDLTLHRGELLALVGPDGSGKTTTLECVAGLRRPTSGQIVVLGEEPTGNWRRRASVGIQLEDSGLPPRLRVEEVFASVASLYARPLNPDVLLDKLGLAGRRRAYFEHLAPGEQRCLNVGLALIGRPPVVLLDEPTRDVERPHRDRLWDLLREVADHDAGILLAVADPGEVETHVDRVIGLHGGRNVLDGPVAGLLDERLGRWRMRVSDPGPGIADVAHQIGAYPMPDGDALLILGARDDITYLQGWLDTHSAEPAYAWRDVTSGPAHLADLLTAALRSAA